MSPRSVAVNGKGGPVDMPEPPQARRGLPRKRNGFHRVGQSPRSIGRAIGLGLLALMIASVPGAVPAGSAPATPQPPPNYVVIDLGNLDGGMGRPGDGATPYSINASGQIAGQSQAPDDPHAFLSDTAGIHDLGALVDDVNISGAWSINTAGQIVGYSQTSNGNEHGFLYANGVMHDLGTLGGLNSTAWAINDAGQVVGEAELAGPQPWDSGPTHAFLYDSTGMHDLGTLLGFSSARAINNHGQVVGETNTADGSMHAFLWQDGSMKDLGALAGDRYCTANGINAAGQIVGMSRPDPFPRQLEGRAFLYEAGAMRSLGTLGGSSSQADGINDLGQVVGVSFTSQDTSASRHAFLYNNGVMIDLNDLLPANSGWVLNEAHAINNAGQIVGDGTRNGAQRAFLLTFPSDPRAIPPAAPSGLSVTTASPTELDLAWTDSSHNAHSFEVQVRKGSGDWVDLGSVPASTTTFAHTGLQSDTHYTYRVRAVNDIGTSDWSNEAGSDTGVHPHADISPAGGLDFGSQRIGTPGAAQTITLTNTGNGPLNVNSITVTGSNVSEFAMVPGAAAPQTLVPGASYSLSMVFTPAGTGPRSAALTITHDASGGSSTVGLTGTGVGPVVRLIPGVLDFGSQPEGLSGSLALLLENTGNRPLTVSDITIQGPNAGDFSPAPGGWIGGTLQPGDITLLNIRFNPAATGSRSASLVIPDDAAVSPQRVGLAGIGTAPLLTVSAEALIFGVQPTSSAQTLTLTNHGDAPLLINAIGVDGPNAGSFKIVSDTGEPSLATGASRTLTIAFLNPAAIASVREPVRIAAAHIAATGYSAILEIKENDPHPGAPHQVTLAALGTGAPAPAATAPAAPTKLTAVVTPANQVTLTWTSNSNNETAFAIWRQSGSGPFVRVGVVAPHTTQFTDTGLAPNTPYTYEVRATNNTGASSWTNTATATLTPPAAPTNLAATVSGAQVDLTWSSHSSNETAFALWRQTGSGPFTRVGVVPPHTTRFRDTGLSLNTRYTYEVRATNNVGASAWSNPVTAVIPDVPPAAPTHLTATGVSAGEIDLSWTAGGGNETGIAIYRQAAGGDWVRIGVVAPSTTRYADRSVQPGTSYVYQVRAHNNHLVSAWTNPVSILTPAAP
jgi:probable HAF family extracellular repeat protein